MRTVECRSCGAKNLVKAKACYNCGKKMGIGGSGIGCLGWIVIAIILGLILYSMK